MIKTLEPDLTILVFIALSQESYRHLKLKIKQCCEAHL